MPMLSEQLNDPVFPFLPSRTEGLNAELQCFIPILSGLVDGGHQCTNAILTEELLEFGQGEQWPMTTPSGHP